MPETPIARLLIVDDETAQMKALCDTLQSAGYSTSGFASASKALEALQTEAFDLVLTDLMMPEMDGIAFLSSAFQTDPNLVGIVMTGHGTVGTAVQALKTGALDYILKPFRLSAVLPVLNRALSMRHLRMENIQLKEAVALHDLSMAIALALDFETVLRKVADAALEQSRAKSIAILLPSEEQQTFHVAVARGEDGAALQGRTFRAGDALAEWLGGSRDLYSRLEEWSATAPGLPRPVQDVPCGAFLPMLTGGKLVGVLGLNGGPWVRPASDASVAIRPPTVGQLKALNILASTGASALEAASLLERLRAAEQRYRHLAENAPDVVFRYEFTPSPVCTYVNPAIAEVTGYSPKDVYADPALSLQMVHSEDRPILEAVFRGEYTNGSSVTMRWIHQNGSVVWVEQRNVIIRGRDGRITSLEGIARDITERKRLEERLRQSQKMEAIGQLTAGVAHDFNNLLTVINGYSDLTLQEIPADAPAQRKIHEVRKAGEQAASLTRQLLAFSRGQALQPKVVNLAELLAEMEQMIRRVIGGGIDVRTKVSSGGNVLIDPTQVQQVILNLAVNARDAMPGGGTLSLTLKDAVGEAEFVALAVADTGCGMTPEVKRRAFEPFFTTKEVGRGTGLGLATVCGIVEQSGGQIQVDSEPGQGTTFTILFPRFDGPADPRIVPREPAPQVEAASLSIRRVMVVDDEPAIRSLLSEILERAGFEVRTAKDGRDARNQASEHPLDLVITDLIMPEVEGLEFIAKLRKDRPNLKLVAMSGLFSADMLKAAKLLGADATLTKPLTQGMILECIRTLAVEVPAPA